MRVVEIGSGVLLVGIGLLLVTGRLTIIAQYFSKLVPRPGADRLEALARARVGPAPPGSPVFPIMECAPASSPSSS